MRCDLIFIYNTHNTTCSSRHRLVCHTQETAAVVRAQAHTRPVLDQNLSQQRRREEGDAVVERSGGVDELLLAISTTRTTAVAVSS